MKKFSLVVISDTIFVGFASFILLFTTFYYFMPRVYAIVCASCFSLIIAIFSFAYLNDKNKKRKLKKKEKEILDSTMFSLCVEKPTAVIKRVYNCLKNDHPDCKVADDRIYLSDVKTTAFTKFTFEGLTKTDVVRAFNSVTDDRKIIIYTAFCSEEVLAFAGRFDGRIEVVSGDKLYALLKDGGQLPEYKEQEKTPYKKRFKNFIKRKNSLRYLLFGTMFILLSFVLPIKTYYLVCGSVMVVLSLVCLFFGKSKEVKE